LQDNRQNWLSEKCYRCEVLDGFTHLRVEIGAQKDAAQSIPLEQFAGGIHAAAAACEINIHQRNIRTCRCRERNRFRR
jgi:hypothetical protein